MDINLLTKFLFFLFFSFCLSFFFFFFLRLDCGAGYSQACDMWSSGVVLYILVCQGMPFSTEGDGEEATAAMQLNIQRGIYSKTGAMETLSSSLQNLITSLLCVDPKDRLTAKEALEHPWITNVV